LQAPMELLFSFEWLFGRCNCQEVLVSRFSTELRQELQATVRRALERDGLLNVPAVAWEVKSRFPAERATLGELEAEVMAMGMVMNAAMLFHRPEVMPACQLRCGADGTTLH